MLKTYKKKDDVPEEQRESAVEAKDGSWVAEVPDKTVKDVEKLTEALNKEREERAEDAKETKKLTKELKALQQKQEASNQGISEESLKKIRDDEEKARAPIIEENERLKGELKKLRLDDQLQRMGLEHGWMPDRVKQAMALARPRADLSKEGKIVVLNDEGKVTAESVEDFLKSTFKKENPFLYAGGPPPNDKGGDDKGNKPPDPQAAVAVQTAQVARVAGAF